MVAGEGGSYDSFREWGQSDGKVGDFDYSVGASRFDTDNARPNNNYRNTAAITDVGWSPDATIADRQPVYLLGKRHWKSKHDL